MGLSLGNESWQYPPPKVLSPCEAGLGLLLSHSVYSLAGGTNGPCMTMSTWFPAITVGCCQGQLTNIIYSLSFPLPPCKPPSPVLSLMTSWPSRHISRCDLAMCLGTLSLVSVGTRSGSCTMWVSGLLVACCWQCWWVQPAKCTLLGVCRSPWVLPDYVSELAQTLQVMKAWITTGIMHQISTE